MSEIDTTQWLKRDKPIINSFRLQHGDIRPYQDETGRIIGASSLVVTILDWFLKNGFLEMHHQAYTMTFLDLKRAHEAGMGLRWCPVNGREEAHLSAGDAQQCYDIICKEIGRKKIPAIVHIAEELAGDNAGICTANVAAVMRVEFDRLVDIMDNLMQKRKEALEKTGGML